VLCVVSHVNFRLEISDEGRCDRGNPMFRRREPSFSLLFSAAQLDQFLRNRPCRDHGVPFAEKLFRPGCARPLTSGIILVDAPQLRPSRHWCVPVLPDKPDQESGSASAVIFTLVAPPSGGVTPISTLRRLSRKRVGRSGSPNNRTQGLSFHRCFGALTPGQFSRNRSRRLGTGWQVLHSEAFLPQACPLQ
jgi:hypothetical protein